MSEHEEVRQWILNTIQLVVDYPKVVKIETATAEASTKFLIKADPRDVGKVIGKQGRTSQSLRVLAGAMGKKFHWHFIVEIEDAPDSVDAVTSAK